MIENISLLEEVKKGGYEASLFTTYNAYLPFYEDVVLRKLVSSGARHNILLIDAEQCAQSVTNYPPQFAGRHYSLVPMHSNGAFHPKVILLVGKKRSTLFIGSHNLTLSGFGFNREITNLVRLKNQEDADAIEVISSAWHQIQGWVAWQADRLPKHIVEMVNKIAGFAPWLKKDKTSGTEKFSVISTQPESPSLWQQLRNLIEGNVKRVIISGAFFDSKLEFLKHIQEDMAPEEIFVGIDPATVQIPDGARKFKGVQFVSFNPLESDEITEKKKIGYLHAKSIVIETENGNICLASGSANPSRPAWLGEGMSGNIEMMSVRIGDEAEADAREIGLMDIPSMASLTDKDWEIAQENWQPKKNNNAKQSFRIGIAVTAGKSITFKANLPELPGELYCEILDQNKVLLASVKANLLDGEYHLNVLDFEENKAFYLRFFLDEKEQLFLVHNKDQIEQHSHTGQQRRFRDALNSLNSDSPDIITLIACVDKIIFAKAKDVDATVAKIKAGKKVNQKEENREIDDGPSLSVDVSETRKSKKKFRLRVSDDLAYLLDILLYHLKLDTGIERPMESLDGKGRSEEEQVDAEDEDVPGEGPDEEEIAAKNLKLCHGKVHTLVGRMINQLDGLKKGKLPLDDIVVRFTGVLAFLRHLRACDGKVFWIKQGQTSFPREERKRLLKATVGILFERKDSILYSSQEGGALSESVSESEDMARLKGLLLWLAWDSGLVLNLKEPFNEKPDRWFKRTVDNAMLLSIVQLVKDDKVVIHEAEDSIAPLCSSDMDWLNWVLAADKKISEIVSEPEKYALGRDAKPGDLAFHPKVPSLGVRMVLNRTPTKLNLLSFDQEKEYIPYALDFIRVASLDQIL